MSTSRKRIIIALGVIAVVVVALFAFRVYDSTSDNRKREEQQKVEYRGLRAEIKRDSLCEVLVELGSVAYSTTVEKSIRFTNLTDAPLALLDFSATCKCTWLELPNKPIEVGESADVKVVFDSRGEYGSIGNYLSVKCSDERANIAIWVSAEVE
ncbi:MAG: DUF1573 domain-containing protein [Alistipes sp.]|nr:DUF1573 domain-containing protein [Alistipes sp.]